MKTSIALLIAQAALIHTTTIPLYPTTNPTTPPVPTLRTTGFAGPGCPQSSDTLVTYTNNNILTLSTPELHSENGRRSECTAQIELTNTSGWQVAINEVLVDGRSDMTADSRGEIDLKVFYSGVVESQTIRSSAVRGSDSPYSFTRWFAADLSTLSNDNSTTYYPTNLTSIFPRLANSTVAPIAASLGAPAFGPCEGDTVLNFQLSAESDPVSKAVNNSVAIRNATATFVWRKC